MIECNTYIVMLCVYLKIYTQEIYTMAANYYGIYSPLKFNSIYNYLKQCRYPTFSIDETRQKCQLNISGE